MTSEQRGRSTRAGIILLHRVENSICERLNLPEVALDSTVEFNAEQWLYMQARWLARGGPAVQVPFAAAAPVRIRNELCASNQCMTGTASQVAATLSCERELTLEHGRESHNSV